MNKNLILIVEDNEEDYFATKRAFKKSGYDIELIRTENATQALDFLLSKGEFKESKNTNLRPSLILLDLNLPGINGKEFLLQIKNDSRLNEIPVVILTTSTNPKDVSYCYQNGANGYQVKSMGFDKFRSSIKTMTKYWFETAIIPSRIK